jgi:hypothetical protein
MGECSELSSAREHYTNFSNIVGAENEEQNKWPPKLGKNKKKQARLGPDMQKFDGCGQSLFPLTQLTQVSMNYTN